MTDRTAGELAALIRDEELRQVLERHRRRVNPTVGEALRDFQEQQVRELVRASNAPPGDAGEVLACESKSARIVDPAADAAWQAACNACKPPPGFTARQGGKRGVWLAPDRAELLSQYEGLRNACGKASPALLELHQRWGYAQPKSDAGGSLSKVLTQARKERNAKQLRRTVKASA